MFLYMLELVIPDVQIEFDPKTCKVGTAFMPLEFNLVLEKGALNICGRQC